MLMIALQLLGQISSPNIAYLDAHPYQDSMDTMGRLLVYKHAQVLQNFTETMLLRHANPSVVIWMDKEDLQIRFHELVCLFVP